MQTAIRTTMILLLALGCTIAPTAQADGGPPPEQAGTTSSTSVEMGTELGPPDQNGCRPYCR